MNTRTSALAPSPAAAPPHPRSRFRGSALLAACCVLLAACDPVQPEPASTTSQAASLTGVDGDVTVTAPFTVLNRYAVLATNASAGSTSVTVTAVTDLDHPDFGPMSVGDLVFIVQMQGASIDTSNGPAYGTITNYNSAGLHEFAVVLRVEGNTLHLACSGLRNSYLVAGKTQVVRVPQLSNLTIDSGGSISARPWDGQRGGVVVLHVEGSTDLSGDIDVSGQGFRAGARENSSSASVNPITLYFSNDPTLGAEKGESIVGDATVYDALGGRYGRGAPGNGGGGGNSHNAGGGGGANASNGKTWTGQGVMSSSVVGAAAWQLDPAYLANNNARTDSSGGGRGGYTYSANNLDALTTGPNNPAWGGNQRFEVGGLGGRPVESNPASRLFLGGGGGAGDGNNNAGADGGHGGGLVYLISSTVNGSGSIRANGSDAQNTTGTHNDAPGGGGGGGSVVVLSNALSGVFVVANGGRGGNQLITSAEAEGPGGGGGGGYIALSGGTVPTSVEGGQSGTTTSASLTEFPVNGATFGATGQVVTAPGLPQPWLACAPIDLGVTITNGQTTTMPGAIVTYTVTVTNAGPSTATNAPVTVPLPANATGGTWTCAAAGGASCQAASGTGGINSTVTVPVGGTVTYTFTLEVIQAAAGTLTVTATAAEPSPGLDVNLADNTATDSDTVISNADLSVDLVGPASPAPQGRPATYTVQVANGGPNTAGNVSVSFPVPTGSTFSGATGPGWTCTEAGGVVTCTRPELPPGGAPDIAITVVPTIPGGTINASVSVTSATPDPQLANNTDSTSTTVVVINQPPVNNMPAPQSTPEDVPLVFSTANGNLVSIADPDAANGQVKVTLTATQGTLTLSGTTGLTFTDGDGTSDTTMTFTGTLADINTALNGLSFAPNANYNGPATLTVATNDQGNTGVGGELTDTDTLDITVTPVNDPPTAVNDTATVATNSTARPINVLANDTAAPDSGETLTITSVTPGSQNGTITITGNGTGITYTPPRGFSGTETFTYTISDGNGGTATATVTVTVSATLDSDEDGVPDTVENETGTDPLDPDSDDDGMEDGEEDTDKDGEVDPGETDPRNPDTDGGGVNDGDEETNGTDPLDINDDIERRVVGRGCSASGDNSLPGSLWMLLAFVGLALRKHAAPISRGFGALLGLGTVGVLAASAPAHAQNSSAIDVQQFKPAPGKTDVLGIHGAGVPGHYNWRAGLYLNYAHEPLVVINPRSDTLLQHLVKNQMGFDLVGSIGLGERFELGAVVPLNLQQGEFNQQPVGNVEQTWKGGMGDLRLVPKALLVDHEGLRLGLVLPVVLPTGGGTALRGQKGIGAQPRLAADYAFEGGARVLANVGINVRSREELLNLSVGNELSYGVGATVPFNNEFTGMASLGGALGLGATGGADEEEVPLEMQAGVQYRFSKYVMGTLGLGRGLTLGYGMPIFRVFTGVSYTAEEYKAPPKDSDGDDLPDVADKCPDEPEDRDGFQDEDGCLDPDNDSDGIPDTADKCPNEPEDKDGFQDEDGCPDPDNDGDGMLDGSDQCANEPEDKDGFQDEDGCPDPDNDGDLTLDTADKCPLKPEDKDGFQDEDGCPDPDNDRDGVADADDECPQEAEVINGVDDMDGCPDKGETKVKVQGKRILILEKVYFATNKDVVLARSFPLLQQVAAVLRANPQLTKIRIEGHTDDRADDAFNKDLSQRRAGNVRKYLVEQAGIDPERLDAEGFGEERPVDTNKTAAGRENNRRVEFIVVEVAEE
ncbi:MAG TPA: OmpA family protein [Myxococcaceae bacterium]